jgi:putative component of membrane protein insertase Oxa1/YidC/SpoIIIJ protein YidD
MIRVAFVFLFMIGLSLSGVSQDEAKLDSFSGTDFILLKEKPVDEKKHIHHHDVKFMRTRSDNLLIRNNPVSLFFGGLMYVYQGVISPQLPSECLYDESCSHFSQQLIADYGLFKGIFTTSDRLMRCNRLSALDIHPLMINEENGKVVESTDIYKFKP